MLSSRRRSGRRGRRQLGGTAAARRADRRPLLSLTSRARLSTQLVTARRARVSEAWSAGAPSAGAIWAVWSARRGSILYYEKPISKVSG